MVVRRWVAARVTAACAEQVSAERSGWDRRDDCDKAAAEEMVCAALNSDRSTALQDTFIRELKGLAERPEYVWRGVYDDDRFDRHVRTYLRKLMKMAKANQGFEKLARYQ